MVKYLQLSFSKGLSWAIQYHHLHKTDRINEEQGCFFLFLILAKTICQRELSQHTIQRTSASNASNQVSLVPYNKIFETLDTRCLC